jgi:capsular polysaccharide biosynthesis protein
MENLMDKNISSPTLQDVLASVYSLREDLARQAISHDSIQELRTDIARQELLLKQILSYLQQNLEPHATVWNSSPTSGKAVNLILQSAKIKKVELPQNKPQDIVAKLRATLIGQFYVRYLKQFALSRLIIQWVWRNSYPIYANYLSPLFLSRQSKQWRPLITLRDFSWAHAMPINILANELLIQLPESQVFPAIDQNCLGLNPQHLRFPEIYISTASSALIYGGTNLVVTSEGVICHDLYDFERDSTSEELHGRTLISPASKRIRWLLHDEAPERIPTAAVFVDACASNYAHWLTEVLSRIAVFCAEERYANIPVVVNDGLHKNIMESLFLVVGSDREIITVPIGRALHVDQLYLTSVTGYVPFGKRSNKLSGHAQGLFSPFAFEALRKKIATFDIDFASQKWPEKIFLRRNSGTRKISNLIEIERLLTAQGYLVIEPEKLTFLQQVQLFKNVKQIIAPTGAALANAIFCNPGTQVAVLMGKHEDMIYKYWHNMLAPLQIQVSYVLGNIEKNLDLGIHGDFFVNPDDMFCLLDKWNQ